MSNGYKVSPLLMEMLMDKYDIITLRIGHPTEKEEAMFFAGKYYRMWFDPIYGKKGGSVGSVYRVNPKNGFGITTTYRSNIHSDDDVEEMFKSINPKT